MKTLKLTDFAKQVQILAKSVGEEYSCVRVGITTNEWKGEVSYKNEYCAYISGYNWVEAPTMVTCLDLMKDKIGQTEQSEIIL